MLPKHNSHLIKKKTTVQIPQIGQTYKLPAVYAQRTIQTKRENYFRSSDTW